MKFVAGRVQDMEDIAALEPTPPELKSVRGQIPRLGRLDASRASGLQRVLDKFRGRTR